VNCRDLEPRLTAYLAGELDEIDAQAARGHLRVCEGCRATAEDHARVREAIEGLARVERPEPPPAMWDAIQRELGQAEIALARQSRWARWWLRARPHLLPAGLAVGACAAAAVLIELRHRHADEPSVATRPAPVAEVAAPDVAVLPPAPRPDRDATAELADEAKRIEDTYRKAVAELLPLARAEVATWPAGRARAFTVELARREGLTVRAQVGRDRDRAWHELIALLERTTLGERVADVR
jgi:Putative zinc-finger